ncbi:Autophagy protein 7 [Rhizina undulata]
MPDQTKTKFAPFESSIELPFYYSLAAHKIDYDKLDDSPRKVLGQYIPGDAQRLQIGGHSLSVDEVGKDACRAEGMIKNFNTIEDFRKADRGAMLKRAAQTIWDAILDGTIYSCPSLLSSFLVLSYADLKSYKFYHLFAFPAFVSSPQWVLSTPPERLEPHETSSLVEAVNAWRNSMDSRQRGFFLAKFEAGAWKVASLHEFERGFFDDTEEEDRYVAFVDPSTYEDHPGWCLRNLLVLVRKRWGWGKVKVLCYRDSHVGRFEPRSLVLNLELEEEVEAMGDEMPKVVGWEKNDENKIVPRVANLSAQMDPKIQADINVDLNLKLMKWRIAPTLSLSAVKKTRCLLLGAGTLGSYVARILLGWGVTKITLVDAGWVSFSNPVRQPLFTFDDCIGGKTEKAQIAAKHLQEIYPGVDAAGVTMMVPMAAHPFGEAQEEEVKRDYEKLKELMENHDAVFLLMDTRESRWLPTVMGKAMGKIVMNAALGFDTWVVMRHGVAVTEEARAKGGEELGCYYCNDVVAPGDSMTDRTLDQQCTVTRPGVAPIASAFLVELLVSLLQHELGPAAPAPQLQSMDRGDHPLGLIPHQMRGFLASFQNMIVKGQAYNCCSACSKPIVDGYKEGGWEFVKRALCEKGFVEEVSGLAEVQRLAEKLGDCGMDSSDEEEM